MFHVRRALGSVLRNGGYVVTYALITLIVATLTTVYIGYFAAAVAQGVVSTLPSTEPASFLRVIDPSDSPEVVVKPRDATVLEDPGMRVLLTRMQIDDRIRLHLPLNVFTSNTQFFPSLPDVGVATVVVGAQRPVNSTESNTLRGDLAGVGLPSISNEHLGPVAVRQLSDRPPNLGYLGGDGRYTRTDGEAVVWLTVMSARTLGVSRQFSAGDIVAGLTCRCSSAQLTRVARAMNEAEREGASSRRFYAVDRGSLIGPAQRQRAAATGMTALFSLASFALMLAFIVGGCRHFWLRERADVGVEQRSGASSSALQIRAQVKPLLAFTLPASVGALLGQFIASGDPQYHLTATDVLVWGGSVLVVAHSLMVAPAAIDIERMRRLKGPR